MGFERLVSMGVSPIVVRAFDRRLRESESWTRSQLQRFADAKLRRLLNHVTANCSALNRLYRESCGPQPSHGWSANDLEQLPTLNKGHLRVLGHRLIIPGPRRRLATPASTGGSTGEPLRFERDFVSTLWSEAALRRGRRWIGLDRRARGLHLKSVGRVSPLGRLRQRLQGFRSMAAFPTHPDEIQAVVARIRAWKPDFVTGYPSSLVEVAAAAGPNPLDVPVVMATGETLAKGQLAILERAFGGKVAQYYGSNEVPSLAYQCEAGSLHVVEEHVVLEVLDDHGVPVVDQPGRVVVTDLDNYVMPFVRYELGDLAILSSRACRCGRAHTVLEGVQGRTQDVLVSPDGRQLHAVYFATRFRDLSGIARYQIVQLGRHRIELRYEVTNGQDHLHEVAEIRQSILEQLGPSIEVTPAEVEAIDLTPRGKTRLVVGLGDHDTADGLGS